MFEYLTRKFQFQFYLKGYQLLLIALGLIYVPYIAWESFWYFKVGSAAIKWHTWLALAVLIIVLFFLPFRPLNFIREKMTVFVVYFSLCWFIGEVHPFTVVPMYTSFQKELIIYSLANENNDLLPFQSYTKLASGQIIHQVSAFSSRLNNTSNQTEVNNFLQQEVLNQIHQNKFENIPKGKLHLVENRIFIQNDSIKMNALPLTEK
jgi:hypothetical protein